MAPARLRRAELGLVASALLGTMSMSVAMPPTTVDYSLPTVAFSELAASSGESSHELLHHMTTFGAVAVTGVPGFAATRRQALEDVPKACMVREDPSTYAEATMADGTLRRTVGARTRQGIPQPLPGTDDCNAGAAALRAVVDMASKYFFNALDMAASGAESGGALMRRGGRAEPAAAAAAADGVTSGAEYASFGQLMGAGDHLEHFHTYHIPTEAEAEAEAEADPSAPSAVPRPALDVHTDNGLLIAMTTGLSLNGKPGAAEGLYVQLPHGGLVRARVPDDAIIFMAGEGAASWLDRTRLRALPHALVLDQEQLEGEGEGEGEGARVRVRSWHGRMFLPPADAVVSAPSASAEVTFGQLQAAQNRAIAKGAGAGKSESGAATGVVGAGLGMSLGCGLGLEAADGDDGDEGGEADLDLGRLLFAAGGDSDCTDDEAVMCWKSCTVGPVCGQMEEAYCVDPAVNQVVDGTIMCPSEDGMSACEVQCCMSVGPNGECMSHQVNTNTTKQDDSDKFCTGIGIDMYMSGFTSVTASDFECLNLLFASWTLTTPLRFGVACVGVFLLAILTELLTKWRRDLSKRFSRSSKRDFAMISLYGLQVGLGYFLMLVSMTYQVELFIMVCVGLVTGHACFNLAAPPPMGTDPCCVGRESLNGDGLNDGDVASDKYMSINGNDKDALTNPLMADLSQKVVLQIDGMTCNSCTTTVTAALRRVPGVADVRVTLATGVAEVALSSSGDGLRTRPAPLVNAVTEVGFDATQAYDTV